MDTKPASAAAGVLLPGVTEEGTHLEPLTRVGPSTAMTLPLCNFPVSPKLKSPAPRNSSTEAIRWDVAC